MLERLGIVLIVVGLVAGGAVAPIACGGQCGCEPIAAAAERAIAAAAAESERACCCSHASACHEAPAEEDGEDREPSGCCDCPFPCCATTASVVAVVRPSAPMLSGPAPLAMVEADPASLTPRDATLGLLRPPRG